MASTDNKSGSSGYSSSSQPPTPKPRPIKSIIPCGLPPPIREHPDWPFPTKIEYGTLDEAGINPLKNKDQKKNIDTVIASRRELKRNPSHRFSKFTEHYNEKRPVENSENEICSSIDDEDIYGALRFTQISAPVQPTDYDNESIEHTFYLLNASQSWTLPANLRYQPMRPPSPDPFKLSVSERKTFCIRFHLLYSPPNIATQTGWEKFAETVCELDCDDISMIDQYNARHNYPVVEIVLTHWRRLNDFKSRKVKLPPSKETIIQVLTMLEQFAFLKDMSWEPDYTLKRRLQNTD